MRRQSMVCPVQSSILFNHDDNSFASDGKWFNHDDKGFIVCFFGVQENIVSKI